MLDSGIHAGTITFDTDEAGFVDTPSGSTGGAAICPFDSSIDGVAFTIDANTFGPGGDPVSLSNEQVIAITQNVEGLGVNNLNPDFDGNIDGFGSNDILIFEFSNRVRLTKVIFENVDNNGDLVFYTLGQSPNAARFDIFNPIPFDTDGDEGMFTFDFVGTTFGIGAFGGNDDFRVSQMNVAQVPLPAGSLCS